MRRRAIRIVRHHHHHHRPRVVNTTVVQRPSAVSEGMEAALGFVGGIGLFILGAALFDRLQEQPVSRELPPKPESPAS